MFAQFLKGVMSAIAIKLLDHYRHLSVQLLKIEAARTYLHGVKLVRLSAIGLLLMGLFIALVGVGLLLIHAGLFMLLPWTLEAKAVLGMCLGLVYLLTGGVALCALMNEKRWMDKSGATRMIEGAIGKAQKDE